MSKQLEKPQELSVRLWMIQNIDTYHNSNLGDLISLLHSLHSSFSKKQKHFLYLGIFSPYYWDTLPEEVETTLTLYFAIREREPSFRLMAGTLPADEKPGEKAEE